MAAKKTVAVATMKNPKAEVYMDRRLEWRWRLIAKNGKIIAESGEGYKSKTVAKNMITKVDSLLLTILSPADKKINVLPLTAKQVAKVKAAKAK